MTQVTAVPATCLEQGHAVFLQPGAQRLADSHVVVGWSKSHPGNLVVQDPRGNSHVIWHEDQVYIPTSILL